MADLVRWLVEPGFPVALFAACPAPQRHVADTATVFGCFPGEVSDDHALNCTY